MHIGVPMVMSVFNYKTLSEDAPSQIAGNTAGNQSMFVTSVFTRIFWGDCGRLGQNYRYANFTNNRTEPISSAPQDRSPAGKWRQRLEIMFTIAEMLHSLTYV